MSDRELVLWLGRGGCSQFRDFLLRFEEDGHGKVFSDLAPIPNRRGGFFLHDWVSGASSDPGDVLLVMAREIDGNSLMELLVWVACDHHTKVSIIPDWERPVDPEEDYAELLKAFAARTEFKLPAAAK